MKTANIFLNTTFLNDRDIQTLREMGRRIRALGKIVTFNGQDLQPVQILRDGFRPAYAYVKVEKKAA